MVRVDDGTYIVWDMLATEKYIVWDLLTAGKYSITDIRPHYFTIVTNDTSSNVYRIFVDDHLIVFDQITHDRDVGSHNCSHSPVLSSISYNVNNTTSNVNDCRTYISSSRPLSHHTYLKICTRIGRCIFLKWMRIAMSPMYESDVCELS
jgi:hypothetical protein